jgi:regulator of sirC expression with transglutaminase-like and TPR domain
MRPADTSPEAWRQYEDILRRMTPEQKLQRAFELSRMVRTLAEAGLRERYPQAEDREIFLRRVRQEWGPELFRRVYGDVLPDERSGY